MIAAPGGRKLINGKANREYRLEDIGVRPLINYVSTTALLWVLLGGTGEAQNFEIKNDGQYTVLTGEITPIGVSHFKELLAENPDLLSIALDSPGGNVVAALRMAELIHQHRLGTYVAPGSICASACSLLFFAGHDRLARGALGVHQMDDRGGGTAETLQYVLAELLDALNRYGVPWEVSQWMLTTPSDEMYWISDFKLEELALNRDLPGDAAEADPIENVISSSEYFASYPTEIYLAGKPTFPDFDGRDSRFRNFRTRIREGVEVGPNFAGHIAVVEIGCGTSCRFAYIVDLRSGEVAPFPYGGEEQYEMLLLYTKDSRLLKVTWSDTSDYESCIEQDLLLNGLEFQVLSENRVPRRDFCNGSN